MSKTNPQPKKLTLAQALKATSHPLRRWGDLIIVQVHKELEMLNNTDFPNGEMRNTFMPVIPDREGKWERDFKSPATDNWLGEIYASGGWIESLAHFSDEALALHYKYSGGIVRGNPFAIGDVGDPSRFLSDCREVLDQIPQPEQKDLEVIRKSVLATHKKDRLAAIEGVQRSKQQKDFREDKQKIDEEKHEQWRMWQADEKARNPQFSRQSKQEQARRLKAKHSINDEVGTIAKRLDPLPGIKNILK